MKKERKVKNWEDLEKLLDNINHNRYGIVINGYLWKIDELGMTKNLDSIFLKIVELKEIENAIKDKRKTRKRKPSLLYFQMGK